MRYLSLIKPALLLLAALFLLWRGSEELLIALFERAPTKVAVANFEQSYRGQRWVEVEGILATDRALIEASRHEAHEGKDLVYLHVPMVPPGWKPTDPIHVVAICGPGPSANANGWLAQHRGRPFTITGVVAPSGYDAQRQFPRLTFAPNVVVVNQGTEPVSPWLALFLVALAVFLLIWSGRALRAGWGPIRR